MDEILDKQPLDIISDAAVWDDEVLADAYLAEQIMLSVVLENECPLHTYGPLGVPGYDYWSSHIFTGCVLINDIADEGRTGWGWGGTNVKAGGMDINSTYMHWWDYGYYIIRNLNTIIERLPSSSLSADFKSLRVAEARWYRAINYFYMVKRYGGIPLITKVQQLDDTEEELFPVRTPEKEVYDFIISEMDAIKDDLKLTTEFGRPTHWAALALKSRAALYAGSIAQFGTQQLNGLLGFPSGDAQAYYQKAYDASQEIIQGGTFVLYNSNPDKTMNFRDLFINKRHKEVIFARQHDYNVNPFTGHAWGWDFSNRPKPHAWNAGMENAAYLEMAEEFEYIDGTPGVLDRDAIQQGLWSMEELWGKKDPRFAATLYTMETPWEGSYVDFHKGLITPEGKLLENESDAYNGVSAWGNQNISGNFLTGFGCLKLVEEGLPIGTTFATSGTDYMVFRYAEILLNFAEAAFELGKSGEALSAINQIRERAGIAAKTSIDREAIHHERKVELAFEGHRYWDLRRWREAETKLSRSFSGLRYILDYETRKYKLEVLDNIDGVTQTPKFFEYNNYYPITLRITGANPNLKENPGYQ
jgi:hypothetical protein